MTVRKFVHAGFALAAALTFSQAQAENLVDVYELALDADQTLNAAEIGYQAALQAKPLARSALLPQINANAGFENHDQTFSDTPPEKQAFFQDKKFDRIRYGVRLDQVLYDKDSWVRLGQANNQIAKAEADIAAARQDLILRVATAYFDVLAGRDSLTFARAEKQAISQQLQQSKERFEVGLIAITDIHEAQAKFDLSKAQEIDAQNGLGIAQESLLVLTGQLPEGLDPLKESFIPVSPEPTEIDAWVTSALENSLALKAANFGLDIAKQEITRRKAGHYPTLGLSAEVGVQDDSGGFSEGASSDTILALALKLPLYTGGRTSASVTEARLLYRQAETNVELQKREAVRQARASYLNVIAGISRVQALKQALASSQSAVDATDAGYEVGTRTAVDVLLALRDTYRAQRDYAQSRYDYILSTFRLKQAAGILSSRDLKEINDWL